MNKLVDRTVLWGYNKGIFTKSTPIIQHEKMVEEVEEVRVEILAGNVDKVRGELGDVMVTVIIQAEMWGLDPIECLTEAVNKITGRSGRMIDGMYVKDEESL
tara:strand:+ start:3290 stop:3595 length:306 start_codon:yes stop_codon:yes gene_type:complete